MNSIPESAKNRISNCSDETLKTEFLRAWRPKPGQMSNTEVMSLDGRTDRQTDEHIIFEAHYTMGPSGNNIVARRLTITDRDLKIVKLLVPDRTG